MHFKTILCLSILFSVQLCAALRYPQYLQAFHEESCVGTSTLFLSTNTNITEEFPNVQHKSTSLQGLWRYIHLSEDYNVTTIQRSMNDVQNCEPAVIGGKVIHLTSVEKLANGDLDDSVLTLFPLEYFGGEPVVVHEQGLSKIEIENFGMSSYVFTGPQSFTTFDGENFTGNATCLEVEWASRDDGFGISAIWGFFEPVPVKSAKLRVPLKKNLFQHIKVAYNDACRIVFEKSRRNSASAMFCELTLCDFNSVRRLAAFSLLRRIATSNNIIIKAIINSNVFIKSSISKEWRKILFNTGEGSSQ